jgi:hypothetical protein
MGQAYFTVDTESGAYHSVEWVYNRGLIPHCGARVMSKGMDSKKAAKKKPAKSADEKRADKKAKKSDTGLFGH